MRRASGAMLAVLVAACAAPDATVPPAADGVFAVQWTDSAGAHRFEAPAVALRCASRRELLITAQRGDSGFGVLVVFDSVPAPGTYAMRPDGAAPRAALALRMADRQTLSAWRSDSGAAVLSTVAPMVAGTFAMRAVTAQDDRLPVLRLDGRIEGAPIVDDTSCARP